MIDRLVTVAPGFQAGVAIILVSENEATDLNNLLEQRLDGFLLPILQHRQDKLPVRWIMPRTGGFSPASGPRPGLPLRRRRRPARPSFLTTSEGPLGPATK